MTTVYFVGWDIIDCINVRGLIREYVGTSRHIYQSDDLTVGTSVKDNYEIKRIRRHVMK